MLSYLLFWRHVNNKVGALLFIMLDRVDFCVVVRSIFCAAAPHDIKYALRHSALKPMKPHVHGFLCFGIIVLWIRPCAVELSVVTGVFGCLWPIYSSVTRRGTADLQL